MFEKYDTEGFGEIPLDDFEVALETRDFLEAISPGKLIILQVTHDCWKIGIVKMQIMFDIFRTKLCNSARWV